ncbi:3-oxoacyl-[acyl-carrier-protein] synthase, mitochondrial-like [Oscarella lobularis]|uniref:3-oxoacyl-[acyl-carrier-protein] synthase, mitochondrial-like n=1 Tax=Oscarella lobularis TaxID=121494 RepID=UPI0033144075
MGSRRVVLTGLGLVTPLGVGVTRVWPRLIRAECGIRGTSGKGYEDIPSRVAGSVPRGDGEGEFNFDNVVPKSKRKLTSLYTAFAFAAANEALTDAGYSRETLDGMRDEERRRIGVTLGMSAIDPYDVANAMQIFKERVRMADQNTSWFFLTQGYKRISPYFIPRVMANMTAGLISMQWQFKGPNHAVSTACTTGTHAIGDAFRLIRSGDADAMIAGATDSHTNPFSMGAFCSIRALSTNFNDCPTKASRPFDKDRDGFVMSEGCGVVFMEELERAKARNARIYAEIIGYGLSGDACHPTAPSEDGSGALNCMQAALRDARLSADAINYINAHATSTPLGDAAENRAIKALIGSRRKDIALSSTKGATGHMMGASGAVEAVFTTLAVHHRIFPPTISLDSVSDSKEFDLNYVPNEAQDARHLNSIVAVSNSYGFGGPNASLCFKTFK